VQIAFCIPIGIAKSDSLSSRLFKVADAWGMQSLFQDFADRPPPSHKKLPTPADTIPPTKSQMVLSVGLPVKNRETSEPKESDALSPKTINNIPAARSAIPSGLFTSSSSYSVLS